MRVRVCSLIHDSGRLQRFASSAAVITSNPLPARCVLFVSFPNGTGNIMTTPPQILMSLNNLEVNCGQNRDSYHKSKTDAFAGDV